MAFIIQKASFKDNEGLLKIIDLFNRGSITPLALSSELTSAAQEIMSFGNNVYVEVVEGKTGGKSFGMAVLPKTSVNRMDLHIYIDKALFGIFNPAQILEGLLLEISNYPEVTKEFAQFNSKSVDFDVDLVDALIEALKLYKISLKTLHMIENAENELSAINCPVEICSIIEKLEKEPYTDEQAKELVVVGNFLPEQIIEAAEDIVKNMKDAADGLDIRRKENTIFSTKYEEVPTIDYYYKKTAARTDNTYPMYQPKEISPDYEPETNQ